MGKQQTMKALLFDDDAQISLAVTNALSSLERSHRVELKRASTLDFILEEITKYKPDIVIASLTSHKAEAISAIESIKIEDPDLPIITVGPPEADELAKRAIAAGAQDSLIIDSFDGAYLLRTIEFAIVRRHLASEAFNLHAEQLKSIVEASTDGVLIVDESRLIQYTNPAAELLLGNPSSELLGGYCPLEFEIGRPLQSQVKIDSQDLWLEIKAKIVPWQNQETAYCINIHDITDHKRLQERLQRASSLKDEFVAHVSHELRTPMNGIVGMASLLKESNLNPDQVEQLEVIRNCSETMLEMINDLLDLSKIEAGRLDLEKTTFDVVTLIEDCFSIFEPRLRKKGIFLSNRHARGVPTYLHTDSSRLRQIITNLLSNAIKHTENGYVHVESSLADGQLLIDVCDTGTGIPAKDHGELFKPFTQLSTSEEKRHGGTGLGLVICQKIARLMGGNVSLIHSDKNGSKFRIAVPWEGDSLSSTSYSHKQNSAVLIVTQREEWFSAIKEIFSETANVVKPEDVESQIASDRTLFILDGTLQFLAARLEKIRSQSEAPILIIGSKANGLELLAKNNCTVIPTNILRQSELIRFHDHLLDHGSIPPGHKKREPEDILHLPTDDLSGHMLVVEDNKTNQLVITSMLDRLGLKASCAPNGLEAVKLCQTVKFDGILMDCRMPVMDGYKATQRIRKISDHYESIPIVAVSADGMKQQFDRCKSAGMDGCLIKPIDINTLTEMLKAKFIDHSSTFFAVDERVSAKVLVDEKVLESLQRIGLKSGKNLLGEVVRIFHEEFPAILSELKDATAKRCTDEISNLAHKLKGSARNIGASLLVDECVQIEEGCLEKTHSDFMREIANLEKGFADVCHYLQWFAKYKQRD